MTSLRIGSLFAGYGGIERAVQSVLGGELAWYSEIEPAAIRVLEHHHPEIPNLGDVSKVNWSSVEPVDVLTGGFPCQDVSLAGRRAGLTSDTRSGLWAYMVDAISALHPQRWDRLGRIHPRHRALGADPRPTHSSPHCSRQTRRTATESTVCGVDARSPSGLGDGRSWAHQEPDVEDARKRGLSPAVRGGAASAPAAVTGRVNREGGRSGVSQTPLERLVAYALDYEAAARDYKQLALDAAAAEAEHKAARAKAILRFKAKPVDGQRISQAEAEARAEADDEVADLYMARLTTAALADAHRQRLLQLRAMVDTARTVVASDRATDFHHSAGYTGAA